MQIFVNLFIDHNKKKYFSLNIKNKKKAKTLLHKSNRVYLIAVRPCLAVVRAITRVVIRRHCVVLRAAARIWHSIKNK